MKRRLLLSLIATVVMLAVLELMLRIAGVAAPFRAFEEVAGEDGATYLQVRAKGRYTLHSRRFIKAKTPGRLRVFAFGGSTTFGMPYTLAAGRDGDVSFPTWLREDVRQRFGIDLEVINCGAIGMPVEGVCDLVEECLDYQPDAFLVLSGHNEFLPHALLAARSRVHSVFSLHVGSLWRKIRLVGLLEYFAISIAERFSPDLGTLDYPVANSPVRAAFHTPDEFAFIHRRYADSLRWIVNACKARDVKLVLGTPPGNLLDYEPSFSALSGGSAEAAQWWTWITDGRAAVAAGKLEPARELFERAVKAHPESAEGYYRLGLTLVAQKQGSGARQALERARDLDGAIRRATSGMLVAVRAAVDDAGDPDRVTLADCDVDFGRASELGAPGLELFVDHVHPTLDGVALIERTMCDALERLKVITIGPMHEANRTKIEAALNINAEMRDFAVPLTIAMNYANLILLRHHDPERRFSIARGHLERVIARYPAFAEAHWKLGSLAVLSHQAEAARASFAEASRHNPRWKMDLRGYLRESPALQKIFRDEGFGDLLDDK